MSASGEQQQSQSSPDTNLGYWLQSWQANRIGFHRSAVSGLVASYLIPKLNAAEQQQCVAFPLCGKTLDMIGVLDAGHRVIGIEGSSTAVQAFFNENNMPYSVENDDDHQCQIYKGTDRPVTIYCTDFFAFKKSLPPVDFIWDRGGLVAITPSHREQYRDCLFRMMTPERTRLFVVAIFYEDPNFSGPPHRVSDDEINRLFGSECSTELLVVHDESDEFNSRPVIRRIERIEERLHLIVRKQK